MHEVNHVICFVSSLISNIMKDFFDVFHTKRIAKNRTAEIEIKLTEMNKNNMIFILEMNGY